MGVKTVVWAENVADTEDHVVRLFGPKSGLVAGDNLILTDPVNRSTCISAVVWKKVDRHVVRSQYHVRRGHGTTELSVALAKRPIDELQQSGFGGVGFILMPRIESAHPGLIAIDSSLPNFGSTCPRHDVQ